MEVVNVGSVAVPVKTADTKQINGALQRLDRALFLDFEMVQPYGLVPVVCEHLGSGIRPLEVFRWQESDGRPKPLCLALVDAFVASRRRSPDAVKQAADANRARKERLHADAKAEMDAIHDEHRKRVRAVELDSLPPYWRPKHFGRK